MNYRLNIQDLNNPQSVEKLVSAVSELADLLDTLYTETAPNGAISARQGKIALYKNGSTYETWQNVDGDKTWQQVSFSSSMLPFVSGDLIVSTVNTARAGWTNVSATYSNKFMRINATALSTGGADTHSHTLSEANLPAHTHAAGTLAAVSDGAHTHTVDFGNNPGSSYAFKDAGTFASSNTTSSNGAHTHTLSGSTGSTGSGSSFSGDNVPAYVTVCVFKKD